MIKVLLTNSIIYFIIYSSCFGFDLKPPIPNENLPCSEEIIYIYNTDQSDRLVYMLDSANFNLDTFNQRDSIRLTRIIELYNDSCFINFRTTYAFAFVYLHTGGIYMTDDSSYFKKAAELFQLASTKSDDKIEINRAENMKSIAYNNYLKETNPQLATKSILGEITDINTILDETKFDSLKVKLMTNIRDKFKKSGLNMPESEIEKTANQSMELIKKQILNSIESAKRKYLNKEK